jgi:putative ABC transport system ATP-binding protein
MLLTALPLLLAGRRPGLHETAAVLAAVGLADRARHRPAELPAASNSGWPWPGLIASPRVLFADEPTGNLDSAAGREVRRLLRSIAGEHGQTVVMVTHDPLAASYADRVVFMRDGRLAGELPGPTPQIVAGSRR